MMIIELLHQAITARTQPHRIGDLQHIQTISIPINLDIPHETLGVSSSTPDEAWMRSSSIASTSSSSRMQPQPMKPPHSHPTSIRLMSGRVLAERIKACSDWHLLRALLLSVDRNQLNSIHVTSAISRTAEAVRLSARMSQKEILDLSSFFNNTLLPLATRLLPEMGPRELSSSIHSIASIMKQPSPLPRYSSSSLSKHFDSWIDSCLFLVVSRRIKSPRDLSSVLWSLAILIPLLPSYHMTHISSRNQLQLLLKEIVTASRSQLQFFNAHDLSSTFVGLERLSNYDQNIMQIDKKAMDGFLQHTLELMSLPSNGHAASCSQSWSNIHHSIDQLGINPGLKWHVAFSKLNQIFLPHCSGQSFAMLAGSMGRLHARISQDNDSIAVPNEISAWSECWIDEATSRLQSELSARKTSLSLSSEDLVSISLSLATHANILIACQSNKGIKLISELSLCFQDRISQSVTSLTTRDLVGSIVALARLRQSVSDTVFSWQQLIDPSFYKTWSKQALAVASSFNSTDVSQSLWVSLPESQCDALKSSNLSLP